MLRRVAVGLASLLLIAGLPIVVPRDRFLVAAASACTGWTSSYAPPPTIKVGRTDAAGVVTSVDTVDFRTYVGRVLANEWTAPYPAYLEAGAIAVKQYGWYWTMHGRSPSVAGGACYDVRDDTWDQDYRTARSPSVDQLAAIEATWRITLRKTAIAPAFFLPHYGSGSGACGSDVSSSRTYLPQVPVLDCAARLLWSRDRILHAYLDADPPAGPDLSIASTVGLAGSDRYGTSAAIAGWGFPTTGRVVYIATGLDYADALSAAAAAAKQGGPVLLVPGTGDTIPDEIAAQLTRLKPSLIKIAGGTRAVASAIETALAQFVAGDATRVKRFPGVDRYETAALVMDDAFGAGPVARVYIATGENFPDAVGGAAAAASQGVPALIVPGSLPIPASIDRELTKLAPREIVVLGGPSVIGDAVQQALAAYVGNDPARVRRVAGADRFVTAALLSAAAYAPGSPLLHVATGDNFPDALSGGTLGGPLLLVPSAGSAPPAVMQEAARLQPAGFLVLGGNGVVPDAAIGALAMAVAAPPSP